MQTAAYPSFFIIESNVGRWNKNKKERFNRGQRRKKKGHHRLPSSSPPQELPWVTVDNSSSTIKGEKITQGNLLFPFFFSFSFFFFSCIFSFPLFCKVNSGEWINSLSTVHVACDCGRWTVETLHYSSHTVVHLAQSHAMWTVETLHYSSRIVERWKVN